MAEGQDWGGFKKAVTRDPPRRRVACPLCGTPLDMRDTTLHCPFDGWTGTVSDKT